MEKETAEKKQSEKMDPLEALFDNAWRRFAARFWVLVWIFVGPAAFLIAGQLLSGRTGAASSATTPAAIYGGILSVVGTVLSMIATLALVNALAHHTGVVSSWRVGVKLFWAAVWISVLDVIAVFGGIVMLIVPGIVMSIALVFATYALVAEDARGMHALRQSRRYVKGHWWAVVGRMLLLTAIFFVAMVFIYSPVLVFAGAAAAGVVYFVLLVCFSAFSAAYTYEMYENLRRIAPAVAAPARDFLDTCIVVGAIATIVVAAIAIGSAFG